MTEGFDTETCEASFWSNEGEGEGEIDLPNAAASLQFALRLKFWDWNRG